MVQEDSELAEGPTRSSRGVDVYFWLTVTRGESRGATFPVDRSGLVIGKSIEAEIRIESPGVSRRHARITVSGNEWLLLDLASTNGTYVNGVRSTEAVRLAPGDSIRLGAEVELRVDLEASTAVEIDAVELLSRRQLEVARLVAQGLTNAEAARELGISPRTVSTHLDHIYARLALRSRAALASWLATYERRRS